MLVPRTPLQAYLLDAAEPEVDAQADRWLAGVLTYGTALERAVLTAGAAATVPEKAGDARFQDSAGVIALDAEYDHLCALAEEHGIAGLGVAPGSVQPSDDGQTRISALTRTVAEEAEQRGALHLAYSLLALGERFPRAASPLERGRVLAHRARIARKADETAIAEELYRRVQALAEDCSSDELRARALIGRGVLAHSKGNYPAARRFYTKAARRAKSSCEPSLIRHAYHGLMVVAAKHGELDRAFKAGWLAFRGAAGDPHAEADMLLNLAQLAFDAGHERAALQAFAAALAREPAPWRRLAALGGAARAAAALGERELLEACARRIEAYDAASASFAYPRAAALWEAARAYSTAGMPAESLVFARRTNALASAHEFHELVLESEQLIAHLMQTPTSPAIVRRQDAGTKPSAASRVAGHAVLRRLTLLAHPERVLAHL